MSEAEYLETLQLDRVLQDEYLSELRADIEEDRENRLINLIGKYIIACNSRKNKYDLIYLQDRRISKGGYWTNFLSNAISFTTKKGAIKEKSKFKYNNPRVYLVNRKLKLEEVR